MGRNNVRPNPRVVPSSGNVFADLGLSGAEERQTKLRLTFSRMTPFPRQKHDEKDLHAGL